MTNFFIFPTTKKVRGPEAEKSANRTGSGRGKGPKSKSDCPDLKGLLSRVCEFQLGKENCLEPFVFLKKMEEI